MQSLLGEVEELKGSLQSVESERAREKTSAMMFYQSLQTSKAEMTTLQRTMVALFLIEVLGSEPNADVELFIGS